MKSHLQRKRAYFTIIKESQGYKKSIDLFLLLSVVISFCFISFSYWFIDVNVVGPSMQPTVNAEWSTLESYKQDTAYIQLNAIYHNGDIIVIELSEELFIIKRLIASGGDTVKIIENETTLEIEVYVNDELLEEDYVVYKSGLLSTYNKFNALKLTHSELFNCDYLEVPEGYVFYLGDNRGQSQDCSDYGPEAEENVVGKVTIIVPYGEDFWHYMWQEFLKLF